MSTAYGAPCPRCDKAPLLRFTTDGNGRHKETLIEGCEHERKKRGICKLCPKPVYGRVGRAVYCVGCRASTAKEQTLAWKHRNLERVRADQRRRKLEKYHADPEAGREEHRRRYREKRDHILALAKAKRRWSHPGYVKGLEARRKQRALWREKNREHLREYARQYRKRKRDERDAATRNAPLDRAA